MSKYFGYYYFFVTLGNWYWNKIDSYRFWSWYGCTDWIRIRSWRQAGVNLGSHENFIVFDFRNDKYTIIIDKNTIISGHIKSQFCSKTFITNLSIWVYFALIQKTPLLLPFLTEGSKWPYFYWGTVHCPPRPLPPQHSVHLRCN